MATPQGILPVLPRDVLIPIFDKVLHGRQLFPNARVFLKAGADQPTRCALMLVCREWYHIINETPWLWRIITASDHRILPRYWERSKQTLLDVYMFRPYSSQKEYRYLIDPYELPMETVLEAVAHRVQTLTLETDPLGVSENRLFLPSLEKLTITSSNYHGPLLECPKLRSFDANSVKMLHQLSEESLASLLQLVMCYVGEIGEMDFARLIKCTNLRALCLVDSRNDPCNQMSESFGVTAFPKFAFGREARMPQIVLGSLTALKLAIVDPRLACFLLSGLSCPSLLHLEASARKKTRAVLRGIISFLARSGSPPLKSLQLTGFGIVEHDLAELLNTIPTLEDLAFNGCYMAGSCFQAINSSTIPSLEMFRLHLCSFTVEDLGEFLCRTMGSLKTEICTDIQVQDVTNRQPGGLDTLQEFAHLKFTWNHALYSEAIKRELTDH